MEPALHVMTWNIRRRGGFPSLRPADRWGGRADSIRALLQAEHPTVLGVQEALADQAKFVEASLGEGYQFIGRGRNANHTGEGNPIVFDSSRLELLDWSQSALSERPAVPGSRSWGNLHPRILVHARFRDRTTGRRFSVVNTHFDHLSARSRLRSAEVIRHLAAGADHPVVVTGDFNATPDSAPLRQLLAGGRLADTRAAADHHGSPEYGTLANYRPPQRNNKRIDWILASPQVRVRSVRINADTYCGGWGSDHLPVHAVVDIPVS